MNLWYTMRKSQMTGHTHTTYTHTDTPVSQLFLITCAVLLLFFFNLFVLLLVKWGLWLHPTSTAADTVFIWSNGFKTLTLWPFHLRHFDRPHRSVVKEQKRQSSHLSWHRGQRWNATFNLGWRYNKLNYHLWAKNVYKNFVWRQCCVPTSFLTE